MTGAAGAGGEDWGARADALLRDGRLDPAIRAYRRAIARDPKSAWHHQGLAVAVARKGWKLAARSFHWRALALDPDEARRWHEAHLPGFSPHAAVPDPVFILGCPHSGTSILARLVGNHPSLMNAVRGETHLFSRPPAEIDATLRRWDRACIEAGRQRWVEKSVTHSFCIPWLVAARPRARFLVSLRDGRDVVCSLKTRQGEYRSVDALIDQWVYTNLAVLAYRGDPRFLWVKYEDLVGDPAATLSRVCRHVGVDYAPEMLDYHRTPIDWNRVAPPHAKAKPHGRELRSWQVNQPLFDGRNRWQAEMTPDDKRRFKQRAQRYLAEYGYAQDDRW